MLVSACSDCYVKHKATLDDGFERQYSQALCERRCGAHPQIGGRSWWKNLGFSSPCGCAERAHVQLQSLLSVKKLIDAEPLSASDGGMTGLAGVAKFLHPPSASDSQPSSSASDSQSSSASDSQPDSQALCASVPPPPSSSSASESSVRLSEPFARALKMPSARLMLSSLCELEAYPNDCVLIMCKECSDKVILPNYTTIAASAKIINWKLAKGGWLCESCHKANPNMIPGKGSGWKYVLASWFKSDYKIGDYDGDSDSDSD